MADVPLVYVAGPFSAPTRAGVESNILAANYWGVEIAKIGACPVIPHANTADPRFEHVQPCQFWIRATLSMLRVCGACLLIPGWDRSSGARGERAEMLRLMRPVFEAESEWHKLERWVKAFGVMS